MNIEYPLHAYTFAPVQCQRNPNDPTDTHYAIFDAKHGCVAHVFDRELAVKMAAVPELVEAAKKALSDNEQGLIFSITVADLRAALKKAGVL